MASIFGIPLVIAYTAAKTAMVGMVKRYATELSPHGVRVNCIAPGWIETEMSRKALEVVKSPTPDMDGDSIGGAVNMVSKSAFDN